MKRLLTLGVIVVGMMLSGCAGRSADKPFDYGAFKASQPKSILVVMPINNSPEAKADTSVLAQATVPLAEQGYYVYPVALVDEVFKQNGLTNGNDIQTASIQKIHQIFNADAIMYLSVEEYGSSYKVIDSVITVEVKARLVDLRNGAILWSGENKQSMSNSGSNNSGILGALISAAINQIVNTVKDRGYDVAGVVSTNLFSAGHNGGLLYGPRHPLYGKDPQLQAK